jgi:subtilase family serine protease
MVGVPINMSWLDSRMTRSVVEKPDTHDDQPRGIQMSRRVRYKKHNKTAQHSINTWHDRWGMGYSLSVWRPSVQTWGRVFGAVLAGLLMLLGAAQALDLSETREKVTQVEIDHPYVGTLDSHSEEHPSVDIDSDWTIGLGLAEARSNETIVLKGNLTIQGGGSLSLDNVTLVMNCTVDGEFWIFVEAGGELRVKMSTITAFDKTTPVVHEQNPIETYTVYGLRYHFVIRGKASIVGSTIEYLWGDDLWLRYWYPGGLEIYSDDVIIDLSRISDAESFAFWIMGASPTIARSTINRYMACGVETDASHTRFAGNYINIDQTIGPLEYCGLAAASGSPVIVDNTIEGGIRLGNTLSQNNAFVANNTIVGGIGMISDGRILNNTITTGPGTGFGGTIGISFSRNPQIENNTIQYLGPLDSPGPTGIMSASSNVGGMIIGNVIKGFFFGVDAQLLSDASYENNEIVGTNWSILCQSQSTARFIGNMLEDSEYGFVGGNCHSTAIENNTFINSRKLDFYVESTGTVTSHLVATNNSFDPEKVIIADSTSSLLVNNYMHARVLDRNLRPLPGATVGVDTSGRPPQQRLTGWEGEAMWYRVPYANYTWDNYDKRLQLGNPFKRVFFSTSAFASYLAKNFNNVPNYPSPRSVNMSSSHWEYFIEVGAPDLVELSMESVQASPNPALLGTPVSISGVVRNWGLVNATNVYVEFRNGGLSGTAIGSNLLGGIARLGGSRTVTISWTPPATGDYTLCAVADPLNSIPELDESNNGACTNLTVVALPDLVIMPSDVSFLPALPFANGSTVLVTAAVRNAGIASSPATSVRFHDGIPPSPAIDGDVPVGPIAAGGSDVAQVQWIASGVGGHEICVVADPDDTVAEIDETNNMACVPVQVLSLPDLAPTSITTVPPSPIPEGTLSQVNMTVVNAGDLSAGGFDLLLFDDSNGNLTPDPGEDIGVHAMAGIAGHSQSYEEFSWSADPAGAHSLCVYADSPPGTVNESNETNNVICIDVVVQPGPVVRPEYVPTSPQPLPPIKVGLSSQVSLSIEVLNQGNGTATDSATVAFREQSSPPFSMSVLNPLAPAATSSRFAATWTSPAIPGTYLVSVDIDYYDNVTEWDETNNVHTWTIEVVVGPVTSLVIGDPNYTSTATYVRSATPLDFSVVDQSGLGIRNTTYRIDGGAPVNYTATGAFFLAGEGVHTVEWQSLDWAGNLEEVSSMALRVDDTPPATAISIGEPKYLNGGNFIKSSTLLTLSVTDGGVGPNSTFYRIWDDSWSQWRDYSTSFGHVGRDGTWFVEFHSFDHLGNAEAVRNETLILDETPPVTTISPAAPFTLTAADSGCGVTFTRYRIDGGSWTIYTGGFNLSEGEHTINYYSIDKLGNVEQERSLVVKPAVEVAVNYKPVVALVFAVILLVAGLWSSKRRPWKGGKDRMAVVKAFTFTTIPMILAESATGIMSLSFEPLRIPPLIGWGMGVDCTILAMGLVFFFARLVWKHESKAEQSPS